MDQRSPQEVVAQGNAIIAKVGRTDIEWVLQRGKPTLQWRQARPVQQPYRADLA